MKKIKTLILITGQQIIGRIEEDGDFIIVESPRSVFQSGPGTLESFPFPLGTEENKNKPATIKILSKHVIIITDLSKGTEKDYLSLISTLYL